MLEFFLRLPIYLSIYLSRYPWGVEGGCEVCAGTVAAGPFGGGGVGPVQPAHLRVHELLLNSGHCLFICLSVYIYLINYLSICLYICLSIFKSVWIKTVQPARPRIHELILNSGHWLYICLYVYINISVYLSPTIYLKYNCSTSSSMSPWAYSQLWSWYTYMYV